MSAAPFPNEYRCRLVAETDSRPCNICYKPTCTVLLASNKADHFYVCPLHLKDKSFASPIHPETYTTLVRDKTRLENEVREANSVADANRPYSWNKLMTNIGWSESAGSKEKNGPEDKNKGEEAKENSAKKNTNTYEEYVTRANNLKKELAGINSAISDFQFKQYVLAKDVYKMRINSTLQAKNRLPRQKPVHENTQIIFPSVPNTGLK
ncbi:hypothetical protein JCM33374_g1105 [Metschnikowia sp. JCM 33374]|nr:hypothetical protein JCM33374_g1105 [Metschnikowia sp. JCM 33374]